MASQALTSQQSIDDILLIIHNNPQPNIVFAEGDLRSPSLLPGYPTLI